MAWGDSSAAGLARFGAGQTNPATDDRVLFLKMFGGEVLAAFTEKVFMRDKVMVKSVAAGKSFQLNQVTG